MTRSIEPCLKLSAAGAVLGIMFSTAACNPLSDGSATTFNSGTSESESMSGKSWQTATNLEINPGNPAMEGGISHHGFSVVADSSKAILAASFYNSDVSEFVGYARTYSTSSGWALPGSQFRVVSSDLVASSDSFGHVSVGRTAAGTFLATFLSGTAPEVSVVQNSGTWGTSTLTDLDASFGDPTLVADFDSGKHLDYGPAIKTVFDSFGRGYVFFRDNVIPWRIRLLDWSEASGITDAKTFGNGVTDVGYSFDAVSDGESRVCVSYEENTPSLYIRCLNSSTGTPYTDELAVRVSTAGDVVMGHALASDGSGEIMAGFYQRTDGEWRVYASKITDGTPGTPSRVDNGMPENYVAAPDGCDFQGCSSDLAYPRPAIAHVGGGYYVIVWMAVNVVERLSALFAATYHPLDGWGPVLNVTSARRYVTRPGFHSPRLHGNSNGDAVLAVRTITSEPSSTEPRLDVYKTTVARYHREVGFRKVETIGNGCQATTSEHWAACTHPPGVAVFSNGDAVVVYQDRDQNLRYRLKAVEFKR